MYNQNLFNALKDVCDFVALESDMDEIIRSVEADRLFMKEMKKSKTRKYIESFISKVKEYI